VAVGVAAGDADATAVQRRVREAEEAPAHLPERSPPLLPLG